MHVSVCGGCRARASQLLQARPQQATGAACILPARDSTPTKVPHKLSPLRALARTHARACPLRTKGAAALPCHTWCLESEKMGARHGKGCAWLTLAAVGPATPAEAHPHAAHAPQIQTHTTCATCSGPHSACTHMLARAHTLCGPCQDACCLRCTGSVGSGLEGVRSRMYSSCSTARLRRSGAAATLDIRGGPTGSRRPPTSCTGCAWARRQRVGKGVNARVWRESEGPSEREEGEGRRRRGPRRGWAV